MAGWTGFAAQAAGLGRSFPVSVRSQSHTITEEQIMQMQWGFHRLAERLDTTRDFAAERQAIRDECVELTRGASLPALKALSKALAALHRELALADEIAGALKRLAAAIETLGDAPERAGYIKLYNKAMGDLERRLDDDGPVMTAANVIIAGQEAAEAEADAEITHRRHEAARKEAERQEAAARREAEERRRNAIAEADAARAALARTVPELDAAPAGTPGS